MNKTTRYWKVRKSYLTVFMLVGGLLLSQAQANVATDAPVNREKVTVSHSEVWGYDLNNHKLLPKGYKRYGLSYCAPEVMLYLQFVDVLKIVINQAKKNMNTRCYGFWPAS